MSLKLMPAFNSAGRRMEASVVTLHAFLLAAVVVKNHMRALVVQAGLVLKP